MGEVVSSRRICNIYFELEKKIELQKRTSITLSSGKFNRNAHRRNKKLSFVKLRKCPRITNSIITIFSTLCTMDLVTLFKVAR